MSEIGRAMSREDLRAFLAREFPQNEARIEAIDSSTVYLRQVVDDRHLRPGGTVSGPTMMTLADTAAYVAVLAALGPVALAVTTSLNINFLRKPAAERDVLAEARLLKLGARLAVAEVTLRSDGLADPVAHATVTYSIPPRRP